MSYFHHITSLKRACASAGYQVECLDDYSDQVLKLGKGGQQLIIGAGSVCAFPINSATAVTLVRDKSHTVNILAQHGYRVPTGDYFFCKLFEVFKGKGKELKDAFAYAQKLGYPVIAKPNVGSQGANVEKLYNETDLRKYIDSVKHIVGCIRIEKPIDGHEYRVLVVDGKPWYSYRRDRPELVFDGNTSVAQAIETELAKQRHDGFSTITLDSPYIREMLSQHSLSLDSRPAQGYRIAFSAARNLAVGADISHYSEAFDQAADNYFAAIAKLFNLRLFGIDLFLASGQTDLTQSTILEINGNPGLLAADQHSRSNIIDRLWHYVLAASFSQCLIKQP